MTASFKFTFECFGTSAGELMNSDIGGVKGRTSETGSSVILALM